MLFKTKRRIIEEYEDRILEAILETEERKDKEYETILENKEAQFKKAMELQQVIYEKKINDMQKLAMTSYSKGRNEVMDIIKDKIKAGEIVRGKTMKDVL